MSKQGKVIIFKLICRHGYLIDNQLKIGKTTALMKVLNTFQEDKTQKKKPSN